MICARGISAQLTDEAQTLYESLQDGVYQIRVIDLASGNKVAIGSGFQFSPDGHIATNYHVIAQIIYEPQQYRLEYVRSDGSVSALKVLTVDVVHDLAIVKADDGNQMFLPLGNSQLTKGTRIFSMGNPYDLGMLIIEGAFNGLMDKSFYRKILFSSSLNSGMSGGPALDRDGRVIGVNVATQGNDISFLVPVEYLQELFDAVIRDKEEGSVSWFDEIQRQLIENQEDVVSRITSAPWRTVLLGEAYVPSEFSMAFKCWGDSSGKDDLAVRSSYLYCSSQDEIFLNQNHYAGRISYGYRRIEAIQKMPAIRFYNLYGEYFEYAEVFGNVGPKDAKNFTCSTEFIDLNGRDVRSTMCVRPYKKYPRLFDMTLKFATVDEMNRGLIGEMTALGLTKDSVQELGVKFLESIQWQK